MSRDDDIAQVAQALRAPGLRYRSFGNEPVRPQNPPATNAAVTIPGLNAAAGRETGGPQPVEEARPTMKLIAEALSPAAPPSAANPVPVAPTPAWPLLDALNQPAESTELREPPRGTLVQLFGSGAPALPAAAPPVPPPAAPVFPPAPAAAAMPVHAGPFPDQWASQPPAAAAPAALHALIPAERVAAPLAEVLQGLGRGSAPVNPAFAALRLPGSGTGSR
jgi:hypothetical protein